MKSHIKSFLRRGFKAVGLNISKVANTPPSPLLYHQIDLVLDVGANVGQFAMSTRQQGYKNKIVSFEPLSDAHNILTRNAKRDASWVIHKRCALGSRIEQKQLNISRNSYSSSFLPMLTAHLDAEPESVYVGKESVGIVTLDSIFEDYYQPRKRVFLKIDTQGFEKEVLDGAIECLERIACVQLELSLVPLYKSQYLYDYFLQLFKANKFMLWSLVPGFRNSETGQLLQFDAILTRQD